MKYNSAAQYLRDEQTQKLAKHMTKGHQVQKAQRMENPLIFQVFFDLLLQGLKVSKYVFMGNHHPFEIRSGPGGKYNFNRILAFQMLRWKRGTGVPRQHLRKAVKYQIGQGRIDLGLLARTNTKPRLDLTTNTPDKFQGCAAIHRNNNRATQYTGKESDHPFRTILAP